MVRDDSNDTIRLVDAGAPDERAGDVRPWVVLVVDDDPAVHSGTRYSLSDFSFEGRPIEVVSVYSAAEARARLETLSDVAVVLLDVVMETEDAGLKLARWIRDGLGNHTARIILRTGQPGQAPQRQVVIEYDLNDYKAKTELSDDRLFSTIATALRSYDQLVTIDATRRALEVMVETGSLLFSAPTLETFLHLVLARLAVVLRAGPDGLVAERRTGETAFSLVAGTGAFGGLAGRPLADAAPPELQARIAAAVAGGSVLDSRAALLAFPVRGGTMVAALPGPRQRTRQDGVIAAAICSKLSMAVNNARLLAELRHMNEDLEQRVRDRTRALAQANAELERLATTDSLTGLLNRRAFFARGGRELARLRRYGRPLAVLLLDLDHFKRVNDGFGHGAGDAVLKHVSALLRQEMRAVDVVGRLGGEEFAALLPETPADQALDLAERLRAALAAAAVPTDAGAVAVTVSIGMAMGEPGDTTLDQMLARADAALYLAKGEGRNRIVASK